ncbi:MAG: hypothetical protein ACXVA9_07835 [Bdellovibrionales bacterium]
MLGSLRLRHFFMTAGVLTLALYQNCAQSPDDGLNSAASYEEGLPFAYDAKIDTLAYMSCSEIQNAGYDPRAYFSFRAGAYNSSTGGIGQTKAFHDNTSYFTDTDRGNALATSSNNHNTFLTLSIRSRNDFQSLWATDAVTEGGEIDAFLPQLDSPTIAGPIAALKVQETGTQFITPYVNYFPGPDDQRLMEASLRFLKYENVANDTRNNLSPGGSSILVVGYSKTADVLDPALRTPLDFPSDQTPAPVVTPSSNTKAQAFGTGYIVPFALPAGYLSGDRRVLGSSGLQEIDLTTNRPQASTWDCAQNYEFMVIRPEDKSKNLVACNATVDRPNGSAQIAALNAIRRVLRVEDWFVDLDNHCVLPKHTGDFCYGTTLGTRTIQYGIAQCVDGPTTSCPHFVSVCIRH